MSIFYTKKTLRDIDQNILRDFNKKTLRVIDDTSLDDERLYDLIRHPLTTNVFRFYVLNEDETINYEIPLEDIVKERTSYQETYQQGVRRNVTLTLINIDGKYTPNINGIWLNTKFRFDVGIKFGNAIKWWRKGVYVINDPTQTRNLSENIVEYQLSDKFDRLIGNSGILDSVYEIPVGSNIKTAIRSILDLKYYGDMSIDSIPIIYDSSFEGKKTPHILTKDANSTLGDIILDLAYMLNAECYYNEYGNLCVIPMSTAVDDYNRPILWHFMENKEGEIEHSGEVIQYNFPNAINEIHVVGDNINGDIASAMVQNVNPASPLSIDYIGRRVKRIEDSNITTDQQAEERCQYELRFASILSTNITIQSYFIPFLECNSIIEVDDGFLGWKKEPLLIKGLSFNLNDGSVMSLNCCNIKNLPFAL